MQLESESFKTSAQHRQDTFCILAFRKDHHEIIGIADHFGIAR